MTIATFNLQLCLEPATLVQSIHRLVEEEQPEALCLQELVRNPQGVLLTDAIVEALGPHWRATVHVGERHSWASLGTAILWDTRRLELLHAKQIVLPAPARIAVHERIFFRLLAGKTYVFPRRTLIAEFRHGSSRVQVVNLHLDHVGGPTHRNTQLEYALSKLNPDIEPTVVCGDFNAFELFGTGKERARMARSFGPSFINPSKTIHWTADLARANTDFSHPLFRLAMKIFRPHLRRKLDFIWTRGFTPGHCKTVDLPGSDHMAVVGQMNISYAI